MGVRGKGQKVLTDWWICQTVRQHESDRENDANLNHAVWRVLNYVRWHGTKVWTLEKSGQYAAMWQAFQDDQDYRAG